MNGLVVAAGLAAGTGLAAALGAGAIERRAARWFLPGRRADPPGSDALAGPRRRPAPGAPRAPGSNVPAAWGRAPERASRGRAPERASRDRALGRDPAPRSQTPPVEPASATGPPFTAPRGPSMLGGQVHLTDQKLTAPRGQAVLVLGHADAGPRAGRINRRRIIRGLAALETDGALIVSGGAVAGRRSEARLLADAARDAGYRGPIALEEASRSTWENMANSQTLLEPYARIVIVSEPVHAAKARALLAAQRPDLASRLVADPSPVPRLASPRRVGLGLIDLLLSLRVAGWARDSAQGLAGLRRLAALYR